MASVSAFDNKTVDLVNEIMFSLSLRIEGILSYKNVKNISERLEIQNRELELQKTELISQSAMLTEQNVELETQKKQLAEASRLKTNFLSNMSHELRTPLNSVIALTSVLGRRLNGKIPEEEYGYLDVISRNGKHLLSLINDILDISRIEAGREEISLARFDMVRTVNEVVEIIQPQARQKNISLECTSEKPECLMLSDEEKIRHILLNIIGNAVKFTGEGSVAVHVSQQEEQCKICVKDTGIGIAENHLPFIFDEFRQAEESTSRRFGGTGLGLALAKKYAQMIGGRIKVKSTPGAGSEFCLFLPLELRIENPDEVNISEKIEESGSLESEMAENKADPGRNSILLVEDSEPALIQIKDFLEESGYEVVVARSGEEAIRAMAIAVPSALILDLMMPGIDGFQVLDIIRGSAPTAKVPVLILTSKFVTKEELGKLKQNNIYQIIRKGDVDLDVLLNTIKKMVASGHNITQIDPAQKGLHEKLPCVLVVEDNPDNMLAATALLTGKYKILEARDGESGVDMARRLKPDFILMDMNLPGINGIEAFKIIRKSPELSHIPVIALTASAMLSDQESILAEGFDAFIAKPIDEKDLFKTINETLYGR
jgi:signal transduction histidine kinase/CheY-like chemotaxis protein